MRGDGYLFDEIADDGVVHVGDLVPLEAFEDVLLLLLLEHHFGDELVEFLVAVVGRQLFETVGGQTLETVHVQNGQHLPFSVLPHLCNFIKLTHFIENRMIEIGTDFDFVVDGVDDPGEEPVVEVFAEDVAGDGCLDGVEIGHDHVVLAGLQVMVTRHDRAHVRQAALHHLVHVCQTSTVSH